MSGLSVGMFLFLVSVGMSLIFGVTRIVNLAHGSFYMVGAYLMVTLVEVLPDRPWSFWVALLVAPLGVAVLGGAIEMGLLRLIYRRDPLMQLILTFGLILVISTVVLLLWGPDNKSVSRPDALGGSVQIFGQPFPSYYILVLALAPLVAVGLWWTFYRTRWGMLIRAATVDREMLGALGVNVAALRMGFTANALVRRTKNVTPMAHHGRRRCHAISGAGTDSRDRGSRARRSAREVLRAGVNGL